MPSAKYLLVEGVDGHLVSDPRAATRHGDSARYVGWELAPEPAEDPDHVAEHYLKAKQVHLDHGDLRNSIRRGELLLHGETTAKNHDAARAALMRGN